MNAAVRWLGDFLRGRTGAWPDRGVRSRVLAIASVLIVTSIATIVDNYRQGLLTADQIYQFVVGLLLTAAAVGLYYRSRAAYIGAYVFSLTLIASLAVPAVWLPIFVGLAQNGQSGSPISAFAIVYTWSTLWVAFFVYACARFVEFYGALRRFAAKLEPAVAALVIVGAIFLVAWSIVETFVGNSFVQAWMTDPDYYASMRLALVALITLPIFSYGWWSYVTLRSRAVRDAFDMP